MVSLHALYFKHLKASVHWLPETNSRQYLLALKYCSHWTESPFHTRGVLSILILQWIEICQTADSFTFTTAAWTQDSLRFTSSVPPASALFYQTFSLLNSYCHILTPPFFRTWLHKFSCKFIWLLSGPCKSICNCSSFTTLKCALLDNWGELTWNHTGKPLVTKMLNHSGISGQVGF